jgi:Holliday junction resolvase RusA-like endonuclease
MSAVEFTVVGRPVPQGSKRAFVVTDKTTGRPRAVMAEDAGQRHKDWRTLLHHAARDAARDFGPFTGPVSVSIEFAFTAPKSRPLRDGAWRWQAVRPDVDKLGRAVLDALTSAQLIGDDQQVSRLVLTKIEHHAPSQARVHVEELSEADW